MPGPLPQQTRRRTNAPTIPTTELPAAGRQGRAPKVPSWFVLGESGAAWWAWAWATPQACGWGRAVGQEVVVARRALLEDDLAGETSTGNRLGICREMRELDDRLGLTPKGLAQLRWVIVAEPQPDEVEGDDVAKQREDRRVRLTAV